MNRKDFLVSDEEKALILKMREDKKNNHVKQTGIVKEDFYFFGSTSMMHLPTGAHTFESIAAAIKQHTDYFRIPAGTYFYSYWDKETEKVLWVREGDKYPRLADDVAKQFLTISN